MRHHSKILPILLIIVFIPVVLALRKFVRTAVVPTTPRVWLGTLCGTLGMWMDLGRIVSSLALCRTQHSGIRHW